MWTRIRSIRLGLTGLPNESLHVHCAGRSQCGCFSFACMQRHTKAPRSFDSQDRHLHSPGISSQLFSFPHLGARASTMHPPTLARTSHSWRSVFFLLGALPKRFKAAHGQAARLLARCLNLLSLMLDNIAFPTIGISTNDYPFRLIELICTSIIPISLCANLCFLSAKWICYIGE